VFGLRGSLRRRYCLWLSALVVIHFLLRAVLGTIQGLREVASGNATLQAKFQELFPLMLVDAITIPMILAAIWYVTKRLMQPFETVVATASHISAGQLDERVAVPAAQDEVAVLARTLNSAFDRYSDSVQRLRRFSSDASHQLRTPLAALRSVGEVALQKDRSAEQYRETIGSMLEEADRLSRIIEQLLMLSRLEKPQLRAQFKPVSILDVFSNTNLLFEPLYKYKRITVEIDTDPAATVRGDAGLLEQVVASLLDNAIKFTPEGGNIRLVARRNGRNIVVRVEDSGPGIPDEERTRIFERFVSILSADRRGMGLGLALVHDIVKIHDGTVEALPNHPCGAVLQVTLPSA
jgi:signal transduction histidine kinase